MNGDEHDDDDEWRMMYRGVKPWSLIHLSILTSAQFHVAESTKDWQDTSQSHEQEVHWGSAYK